MTAESQVDLLNSPERESTNPFDSEYHKLLMRILTEGVVEESERTGTGTIKIFGPQMEFDLSKGFPLITTKKIHTRSVVHELLWFLKGESNTKYLTENNVHIWDEWADEKGELGPVYGAQWRSWQTAEGTSVDQISEVVETIKNNPGNRRMVVNAWNVGEIDKMALPPCHLMFQFYVANDELSCKMYQRSADMFLGVPFNIASYSLLTAMVAQATGYKPGKFIHTFGDTHLYLNHLEQVKLQLSRKSLPPPTLLLNPNIDSVFDFGFDDIQFENYQHQPFISAPISV